jgi:hypothetical protein
MAAYKGLQVPLGTDPANVPDSFRDFVDSLDQSYASTSLADAANVPDNFIVSIAGVPQYRNGGVWRRVALHSELPNVPNEIRYINGNILSGASVAGVGDAAPLVVQAGTNVFTTDTAGNALIEFPETFPNAVGTFIVQVGDVVDPAYTHLNGADFPDSTIGVGSLQLVTWDVDRFRGRVRVYGPGGFDSTFGTPLADGTLGGCGPIRVNWMAMGW